jgi:hypothetical protein
MLLAKATNILLHLKAQEMISIQLLNKGKGEQQCALA